MSQVWPLQIWRWRVSNDCGGLCDEGVEFSDG
jgi:hypothetical protein